MRKGAKSRINLLQSENECSTDERALKCCSLKSVKNFLPGLIKSKTQCKQLVVSSAKNRQFDNTSINTFSSSTNMNNMQICQVQAKSQSLPSSKKILTKNDEYMYDLAHFLFKISDLLLQVTEYEKKKCVKENDLRRMLNIVKTEIMKSFLKGKTKRVTMNKIVVRLTYLDKYIQQMNEDVCLGKVRKQASERNFLPFPKRCDSNRDVNINKITSRSSVKIYECTSAKSSLCLNKNVTGISSFEDTQPSSSFREYNASVDPYWEKSSVDCEECRPSTSFEADSASFVAAKQYADNDLYPKGILKNKGQQKTCFTTSRGPCKSTVQQVPLKKVTIPSSVDFVHEYPGKIRVGSEEFLKLNNCYAQSQPKITNCGTLSKNNTYSATTSPDGKFPKIDTNLMYKKRHMHNEGDAENKLTKQISAQKLRNKNDFSEHVEEKMQTDDMLLTENADYQIISMNVLYSKTHVRYIIPDWMQVDYNIDQTPKLLCKQDLEDGIALTSYKADSDGTIHFTLAFSSEELCNLVQSNTATGQLITKLRDIRSIWAESARLLYETLIKQYEDQNKTVKYENCDSDIKICGSADSGNKGDTIGAPKHWTSVSSSYCYPDVI